jgi:cob(I)alamin adenosyltransferase
MARGVQAFDPQGQLTRSFAVVNRIPSVKNLGMKIYTRTGDDGTTGLLGGARTRKSDPRIECVGSVDELNAAIGVACCAADGTILAQLSAVQHELFIVGANLAAPVATASVPSLDSSAVQRLEAEIDSAEAQLAPLREFILPAGTELAARLHLARAICRRAERLLVALAIQNPMPLSILPYMNRLSDWLFALARLANHQAGRSDAPWRKG